MKRPFIVKGMLSALLLAAAWPVAAQVLSPQELFRRVSPSVVVIEVSDFSSKKLLASGSGVVIGESAGGYGDDWIRIVTNCHVVSDLDGQDLPFALIRQGANEGLAVLSGKDAKRDLCTLDGTFGDVPVPPVAHMGSSQFLEVGDLIYAVGAPQGLESTLSNGIVSGFREYRGNEYIQVTAPISPGSSGGGLFDTQGRLVGITTMYLKDGQALNFAAPVEWVAEIQRAPVKRVSQPASKPAAREPERPQPKRDRWMWVADSVEGTKFYVDTQTVQRDGSDVTVWIKAELEKPKTDKAGDIYDEEKFLDTHHCASRQVTRKYYSQRLRDSLVYSKEFKSYEMQRKSVTPDTVGEGIYDEVCGL